jgi:O-antigen/teichoic acid export membrane protein
LAFLLSLGTVFFEYSTALMQSTHRFALVARITIAQALGKLIFGLILIWQGVLHATSALLIYGLLPGIGALLGWNRQILSSFRLPNTWKKDLRIILSVAKWTSIAAIAATLADNVDTLIVQSFMRSYDTGIWSGAARIATFASVIGWSIGSVLSVRVARYHDPKHLRYLSKPETSLLVLLFFCVPLQSCHQTQLAPLITGYCTCAIVIATAFSSAIALIRPYFIYSTVHTLYFCWSFRLFL